MEDNSYDSPHDADPGRQPGAPPGPGFTLVKLLGVVAIIALLIALLLPDHRGVRPVARRSGCASNLKQISLALQNYVHAHGALPPAYTTDASGKRLHSWRTLILPHMEEQALYDSIDLTKPWDDPVNAKACQMALSVYQCPSFTSAPDDNRTTYLAVLTPSSCFRATESRKLAEITDGLQKTLTVIDVDFDHAVPWMSPVDADENLVLSLGPDSKLPHPGMVQVAFADGSVQTFDADTPPEERQALISIAGGD